MAGFFEDDNGNKSSVRLRAFITLMVFLVVWSVVAIVKKEIPSIPESVLIFLVSILGLPTAQRIWGEKPEVK
ncbi:MAG: hypothetical protein WCV62_05645 [Candidatus Peribacteraceae bacterium]|jgi:hypothetical protein